MASAENNENNQLGGNGRNGVMWHQQLSMAHLACGI